MKSTGDDNLFESPRGTPFNNAASNPSLNASFGVGTGPSDSLPLSTLPSSFNTNCTPQFP